MKLALPLLALLFLAACGTTPDERPEAPPPDFVQPAGDDLHAGFDTLLRQHVDGQGRVDYAGLAGRRPELERYLQQLNFTRPDTLNRTEQLAYWINAYNAFTLDLILDHYPGIQSIKDIPSFPVDQRWKARIHAAGGTWRSLDEIENQILRPTYDEPRIHFAINCASESCPILRNEAYLPSRLEAQLTDATQRFLADASRGVTIDTSARTLRVSKLFEWYRDDFVGEGRGRAASVAAYIRANANRATRSQLELVGDTPDIESLDYDWSLNGR